MLIKDYTTLEISGKDSINLLNNLATNLIKDAPQSLLYSCLLTPNGRFMFDFMLLQLSKNYIIISKYYTDTFMEYINMYKMSTDVSLIKTDLHPSWNMDGNGLQDPRNPNLGYWEVSGNKEEDFSKDFHLHRIALKIPDGFHDLTQKESIILDYGFDILNAISYTKGCYLGQELIARTHHTGIVRKKIYLCQSNNELQKGTDITQDAGKVGKVLGGVDGKYLAQINFEKADFTKPFLVNGVEVCIT